MLSKHFRQRQLVLFRPGPRIKLFTHVCDYFCAKVPDNNVSDQKTKFSTTNPFCPPPEGQEELNLVLVLVLVVGIISFFFHWPCLQTSYKVFSDYWGVVVVKFFKVPLGRRFSTDFRPKVIDQPSILCLTSIWSCTAASKSEAVKSTLILIILIKDKAL